MLRFYRAQWARLRDLEAQTDKGYEDLQTMDRLRQLFADDPEPSFLQRLDALWRGTLTSSGDPIWDEWTERVRTGNIPLDWWGPLGPPGAKG